MPKFEANPPPPPPPLPKEVVSAALTMPTPEQIATARAVRKSAHSSTAFAVGTVLGLPPGWVAAKLCPTLSEGRKAVLRAKWSAKGWIKMDGLYDVVGYPLPMELWVKMCADFAIARAERDAAMRELARTGQMILGPA